MAFWKFTGTTAEAFPGIGLTAQPGYVYDFGSTAPPAELLPKEGVSSVPASRWTSDPGPASDFLLAGKQASDIASIRSAKWFGAVGNGVAGTTGTATASSATFTDSAAVFTPSDIGKIITINGAGAAGATHVTTIAACVSATQITLTAAAVTTVTGTAGYVYGTDDATPIAAALTALSARGGQLFFPAGIYLTTQPIVVPGGVKIAGPSMDYSTNGVNGSVESPFPLADGAVIVAVGASMSSSALVSLGSTVAITSGTTSPSAEWLAFNANGLAADGLRTVARRCNVTYCIASSGLQTAFNVQGQNTFMFRCIGDGCQLSPAALFVTGSATDVKIIACEFRYAATNGWQVKVDVGCGNLLFQQNHMYGYTGAASSGNMQINGNSGDFWRVDGNIFDATWGTYFKLVGAAFQTTISSLAFTNNQIFGKPGITNGEPLVAIDLTATGSPALGTLLVSGNVVSGQSNGSAFSYLIARVSSTGSIYRSIVVGNIVKFVSNLYAGGFVPTISNGNVWTTTNTESGTPNQDVQSGTTVMTGNGATTAFTINHNIGAVPTQFSMHATNAAGAAASGWFWSATSTVITVTFTTAPATGTLNFSWRASFV